MAQRVFKCDGFKSYCVPLFNLKVKVAASPSAPKLHQLLLLCLSKSDRVCSPVPLFENIAANKIQYDCIFFQGSGVSSGGKSLKDSSFS